MSTKALRHTKAKTTPPPDNDEVIALKAEIVSLKATLANLKQLLHTKAKTTPPPDNDEVTALKAEIVALKATLANLKQLLRFHTGLDVSDEGKIKLVNRKT